MMRLCRRFAVLESRSSSAHLYPQRCLCKIVRKQDRIVQEFFQAEFKGLAWMTRAYLEARIFGPRRTCPACGGQVEFRKGADRASDALYYCEGCGEGGEGARLAEEFRFPWALRTLDEVLRRALRDGRLVRVQTRRGPVYTLPRNLRRFPDMAKQIQNTRAWGVKAVYVPLRTEDGVRPLRIVFGDNRVPKDPSWQSLDARGRPRASPKKAVGHAFIASVPREIPSQLQYRVTVADS